MGSGGHGLGVKPPFVVGSVVEGPHLQPGASVPWGAPHTNTPPHHGGALCDFGVASWGWVQGPSRLVARGHC